MKSEMQILSFYLVRKLQAKKVIREEYRHLDKTSYGNHMNQNSAIEGHLISIVGNN